jgi:hypothetical protein
MQKKSFSTHGGWCGIVCLFLAVTVIDVVAQPLSIKPRKPVVCYQATKDNADRIDAPASFRQWNSRRSAQLKTATFEVEYVGFPADNLAKNAFQKAVDIWQTQLASPITIHVRAQWAQLDAGVLGQAIWGSAFANFDGAPHLNTYYPVALAEKIAGRDLNPTTDPDIVATFSSSTNWYLGTDGNPPAGRMDLVTVVLHELAHGLGFTDTYDGEEAQGRVGLDNGGTATPFVYDLFIENGSNQKLFTSFLSPSTQLKTQLVSNGLSYNSPLAVAALGFRPKVYAPNPFNSGSSIAHLDETFFSTPGDANKLMTPQIAPAESIHSPGSILLNIFSDMGWVFTKIKHAPLKDTERKDGQPYIVKAEIQSDNGYDDGNVILNYTTNGTTFTQLVMTPTANPNEFEASIPGVTGESSYGYFLQVNDILGRTFTNPGKVETQNQQPTQQLIVFEIGPDDKAPEIVHTPVDFLFQGDDELVLQADVTDNIAVASVSVKYSIAGGSIQTAPMQRISPSSDTYTVTIPVQATLQIGDLITYQILATDMASTPNQKLDPETENYTVFITGTMPVQDTYVNSFDEPTYDFIGNNFKIETMAGFENGAIHSKHPYADGSGANSESNYIYQLQIPIRLDAANPYIRFDEIVLVEPGETGSKFGDDDFYDYVVVEGSKDDGQTWSAFADGYDSRANSKWLTRYNTTVTNNNSDATGDRDLFVTRTIDMLENDVFKSGDQVKIRFRMFADQAAHGWGWAIDNLSIQGPVTALEEFSNHNFDVFPNPVTGTIVIELGNAVDTSADFQILTVQGKQLHADQLTREGNILRKEMDLSSLPDGVYIIKTIDAGKIIHKKILKHGK